jgi:CubicO group peptidase (beta-lactamase class C family)
MRRRGHRRGRAPDRLAPILRLALVGILMAPSTLCAARTATTPVSDAQLARGLDAFVRPLVERGDLSGQLLIARGGKVVLERSFGFADRELRVPVSPTSRFNIASVTKPMTLVIALKAIEQKQIGYHDSIARWLPDFPRGREITIEHLLRHRSGIPHELVPDSLATQPRTAAEMVELARRLPLDFTPGSKSSYSSGGFTVLARILEIALGKDYASLLAEQIFVPLGMTHSLHADATVLMPDRVAAYVSGVHGFENAAFQDFSGLVGAGSVWSTARDLDKFVQAVVTGRLGESIRQSLVRGGTLDFNGRTGGFRAFADWDSATGLEVLFTGNTLTGAPDLLRAAVKQLAAGATPAAPAFPELSPAAVDEAVLRRYEGVFRLENGVRLVMSVRSGTLFADNWKLLPTRDGGFYSPSDYGLVRGVAGADGRIERLDWTQDGTVYPAPRVSEVP